MLNIESVSTPGEMPPEQHQENAPQPHATHPTRPHRSRRRGVSFHPRRTARRRNASSRVRAPPSRAVLAASTAASAAALIHRATDATLAAPSVIRALWTVSSAATRWTMRSSVPVATATGLAAGAQFFQEVLSAAFDACIPDRAAALALAAASPEQEDENTEKLTQEILDAVKNTIMLHSPGRKRLNLGGTSIQRRARIRMLSEFMDDILRKSNLRHRAAVASRGVRSAVREYNLRRTRTIVNDDADAEEERENEEDAAAEGIEQNQEGEREEEPADADEQQSEEEADHTEPSEQALQETQEDSPDESEHQDVVQATPEAEETMEEKPGDEEREEDHEAEDERQEEPNILTADESNAEEEETEETEEAVIGTLETCDLPEKPPYVPSLQEFKTMLEEAATVALHLWGDKRIRQRRSTHLSSQELFALAMNAGDATLAHSLSRYLPTRVLMNRRPVPREILKTKWGTFLACVPTSGTGINLMFDSSITSSSLFQLFIGRQSPMMNNKR